MKREEAIKLIDTHTVCFYNEIDSPTLQALHMAIEALQAEPTHGRLIDADALMEYCSNQKTKTISNNDIARFPTVQAARPTGKWIMHIDDLFPCESTQECSICHAEQLINGNDDNFCPNCGTRMLREEKSNEDNGFE